MKKAAGEVLTAKQAPHRPGTAPALGLRASCDDRSLFDRTSLQSTKILPAFRANFFVGLSFFVRCSLRLRLAW